ncbi:hypothetical protein NPIL_142121 [Nephila pilipes]|uniref:Uncharacterized protein n=1 Tax=Nephila pilipes TaxID=299642 RepID=A0A8X6N2J9_NEPPI|nr:hypothetical protein NPIL_142121 [Nephila pilipes]
MRSIRDYVSVKKIYASVSKVRKTAIRFGIPMSRKFTLCQCFCIHCKRQPSLQNLQSRIIKKWIIKKTLILNNSFVEPIYLSTYPRKNL